MQLPKQVFLVLILFGMSVVYGDEPIRDKSVQSSIVHNVVQLDCFSRGCGEISVGRFT